MSRIANAKARALKGNVSEAFKNEAGAIDLASIMVGIIVIGLIGGVIAATVFAVIPWAQDNAAKQQLDSVAAAQSAYIGLATETSTIKFGNAGDLSTAKLFDATTAKTKVAVQGSGTEAHYIAAKQSASGKIFYVSDTKTQPTAAVATATATQAAESNFTGANIPGGTVINSVTWGSPELLGGSPAPATNVAWTGTF